MKHPDERPQHIDPHHCDSTAQERQYATKARLDLASSYEDTPAILPSRIEAMQEAAEQATTT
jgi:hypothetical protein